MVVVHSDICVCTSLRFLTVFNLVGKKNMIILPYSLKYSRIKYFAVWLNSAQNNFSRIKFSWSSVSPVKCMRMYTTSTKFLRDKIFVVYV